MTTAFVETITTMEKPQPVLVDVRACASCQRSLASVIQTFEDGEAFPLCVSCLVPVTGTTLIPIIPVEGI